MYCIKCGKKNTPGFTYCYNCGTLLVQPSTDEADKPKVALPEDPARQQEVKSFPPPNPFAEKGPTGRPGYPYGFPPFPRRGETQRFPVAPNGKPYIVIDFPNAFHAYKNKEGKQVYASFANLQARMLAVLVDTFVFYQPVQILLGYIVVAFSPNIQKDLLSNPDGLDQQQVQNLLPGWVSLLAVTLYLLYCILMTWRFNGQTIGKKLLRIKVIRKDGSKPDFQTALTRNMFGYSLGLGIIFTQYGQFGFLIGFTLFCMVVIGFGAAFFDAQRRGWHDRLAETLVVGQRELVEGVNY